MVSRSWHLASQHVKPIVTTWHLRSRSLSIQCTKGYRCQWLDAYNKVQTIRWVHLCGTCLTAATASEGTKTWNGNNSEPFFSYLWTFYPEFWTLLSEITWSTQNYRATRFYWNDLFITTYHSRFFRTLFHIIHTILYWITCGFGYSVWFTCVRHVVPVWTILVLHGFFSFLSSSQLVACPCTMKYLCANPCCPRIIKKKSTSFPTMRGLSLHLQFSPSCQKFVFDQSIIKPPTLESFPKRSSSFPTSQLFKKQRLHCNPTFMHCQIPDNVDTFATDVPLLHDAKTHDDDPSLSFFDDNMSCLDETFLSDDKSLSYEESNVIEELFQNHVTTSSTLKECPSDYICFTTTQKCFTSLML